MQTSIYLRMMLWGSAIIVQLLPAMGADATNPDVAKKLRRLGHRLVGISTICHPEGQNAETTEKLIDKAALDKPDIILLTEGCMQNTARNSSREEKDAKAELLSQPGPISQLFARKAQQHRCYILASYYRKPEKGSGHYNSAVLFDRQGKIAGCYDKTFPTVGEMEDGVIPGKGPLVFETDFGRIGALICFDFNFEDVLSEYKNQGAELLCFLSNYRAGKFIPAAALRNRCFIASAVPGENGVIVDPLGRTLAESSMYGRIIFSRINLDSQIVHIDYNADRVRKLKEKYGPLVKIETASPEAYYYLTSLHPENSIGDMIREFEIETLEAYLQRARKVRDQHLPK